MQDRNLGGFVGVLARGDTVAVLGAVGVAFAVGAPALVASLFAALLGLSDAATSAVVRLAVLAGIALCWFAGTLAARREDVTSSRMLWTSSIPLALLALAYFAARDDLIAIFVPVVIGSAGVLLGYWYGSWRSRRTSAST